MFEIHLNGKFVAVCSWSMYRLILRQADEFFPDNGVIYIIVDCDEYKFISIN